MEVQLNDLKTEYNIIDIRDRYSYDIDHVYNSINIPMYELLNNYQYYLNKNDTYYIYCKSGIRSKKTCNILNMFGYNVINVKDGFGK